MYDYLSDIENKIRKYFITIHQVEKLKIELNQVMKCYEDLNGIKRNYDLMKKDTCHIESKMYETKGKILAIQEKLSEASVEYKLLDMTMHSLDGEDMQLMKLRYADNLKYDKIAESLYISKSTAFRKNKKVIMKIADNLN